MRKGEREGRREGGRGGEGGREGGRGGRRAYCSTCTNFLDLFCFNASITLVMMDFTWLS